MQALPESDGDEQQFSGDVYQLQDDILRARYQLQLVQRCADRADRPSQGAERGKKTENKKKLSASSLK